MLCGPHLNVATRESLGGRNQARKQHLQNRTELSGGENQKSWQLCVSDGSSHSFATHVSGPRGHKSEAVDKRFPTLGPGSAVQGGHWACSSLRAWPGRLLEGAFREGKGSGFTGRRRCGAQGRMEPFNQGDAVWLPASSASPTRRGPTTAENPRASKP